MRILFMGCVEFSEVLLAELLKFHKPMLVGIITRRTSSINADFRCLDKLAFDNHIPFIYAEDFDNERLEKWIRELNPDFIYCLGWSYILNSNIISIPTKGVIGYHPACLPYNRGRHPIIWALALGLKKTASTFFFIDEGIDSGDIIDQQNVDILDEDMASSLYKKLMEKALEQVLKVTESLEKNDYVRLPQDHSIANYWRKRSKPDGIIDWRMSCKAIYNLVRALSKPYVGADASIKSDSYKVWKVKYTEACFENIEPGKVLQIAGNVITVKCGDGIVHLVEHDIDKLPNVGDYL